MPDEFGRKALAAQAELRPLASVWQEQKAKLDQRQLDKFNRELRREWAIHTGLIERLYVLERGTTQVLIEQGIKPDLIPARDGQDSFQVFQMLRDHENVFEGLFDFVGGRRELTVSYVKEIHAEITRSQEWIDAEDSSGKPVRVPLEHGQFKRMPNNPINPEKGMHEYCPPVHVVSEMDNLVTMHKTHDRFSPLARAAWLHHRFAQIHPFQDGNGRVARCLATLVFIRAGWFPLVVLNEERDKYIDALEKADNGDLSPLICHFAERQKKHFFEALRIADQVRREDEKRAEGQAPRNELREQRIAAINKSLKRKEQQKHKQQIEMAQKHVAAMRTADILHDAACKRLQKFADIDLAGKLGASGNALTDWAAKGEDRDYYYRWQIVQTAKALNYFANTEVHRAWIRLAMEVAGEQRATLLLSFHGIGREYRGIVACAACFFMQRRTDESETEWQKEAPIPLGDVFQINYEEEQAQAERRFESWLEEVIDAALDRALQEF